MTAKPTLEVRGFTFGNEAFPPQPFTTVTKAMTFMAEQFGQHRGLVCYLESGDRVDEQTFVPHENGLCLKLTEAPRTRLPVQQVA